jgi:uncharacterized membrane protein
LQRIGADDVIAYVIAFTVLAVLWLALNAVTGNKSHPGRLLIWFCVLNLIGVAFLVPLDLIFHPRTWVLYVCVGALSIAVPDPKWVKR